MIACLSDPGLDDRAPVVQAFFAAPHCHLQGGQVRTAEMAQLDALEVIPNALGRIQLGRIAGQPLQMQPPGPRRALYLPAIVAMRHNPAVHALALRLQAGKQPMVIVGAAMRKLLHLMYGVLNSGKPFYPAVAMAA